MSSSNANRKDPAWCHGTLPNPNDTNKVKCNYCGKVTNGGISRFKKHLVGGYKEVKACGDCPSPIMEELKEYMANKKESKSKMDAIPHFDKLDDEVIFNASSNAASNHTLESSSSAKRSRGPIDYFYRECQDQGDDVVIQKKNLDSKELDAYQKKMRDDAVQAFSRWMYDVGIPFNAVNYDSFATMVHAMGDYGRNMKPPSYHEVRVTSLNKEVERTKELMKGNIEEKEKHGCSLMMDGWKDRKGRSIINFLMNTPKGSMFMKSMDASSFAHTGEKMFELLDKFVKDVGEEHVVQVVTDSASSNVLAGRLLEAKYQHLYWTPCAAHCIDLMCEDIFKLPTLKKVHEQGVAFNAFIYNRAFLLNMLRDFTKKAEMVRPAKTRFATAFLTLKRFLDQKKNLKKMFTSDKWNATKISKEPSGKRMMRIILSTSFWNNAKYAVKVTGPLVSALRLVDGEKRPAMGYIYEAMDQAKEEIAASFSHQEEKYRHVFQIIDNRWNVQLHRPLHAAGHFLNPQFFYSNPNILQDEEIMTGFHHTVQRLVRNYKVQDAICSEMDVYAKGERMFGIPTAIRHRSCDLKSPAQWWSSYGSSTPNLQNFAIKVLNLTCSSSGCERNWSVFEHLHSKRRSRLEHERLSMLVYVKYNRALRRRYLMRENLDPIILPEVDVKDTSEWKTGIMEDVEDDEENERVFSDDDDFTWGLATKASDANEPVYVTRTSQPSITLKRYVAGKVKQVAKGTSVTRIEDVVELRGKKKVNVVDEELDENEEQEQNPEGYENSSGNDSADLSASEDSDDDLDV